MATLLPKSKSATYRFLKEFHAGAGDGGNLLCLLGGKWEVPDEKYPDFLKRYAAEVGKYAFGFVERRCEVFPYMLDLDFDCGYADMRVRGLHAILRTLLHHIVHPLLSDYSAQLGVNDEDVDAKAQEVVWKTVLVSIRDGKYHVIFPQLLVTTKSAKAMNCVLRSCLMDSVLSLGSTANKVIDDSVVVSNGLRMLGSYKKDTSAGVYVPCTIDFPRVYGGGTFDECVKLERITHEALVAYSIHYTPDRLREATAAGALRLDTIMVRDPDEVDSAGASGGSSSGAGTVNASLAQVPFDTLKTAVMKLPVDYYGNGSYDKWSRIVWTVYNIASACGYLDKGRELAHEFSRQGGDKYDEKELDKMWDNAKTYGRLRYWGSLVHELRVSGVDMGIVRSLCETVTTPKQDTPVNFEALQARLLEVCPDLQGPIMFTVGEGHIAFVDHTDKKGSIDTATSAVSVAGSDTTVFLLKDVPVPASMSICHTVIPDDMRFKLNFEGTELAMLSQMQPQVEDAQSTAIAWHYPWKQEGYLTVSVAGVRKGGAISQKRPMTYVQKHVQKAVAGDMGRTYGITLNNCTININMLAEDKHCDNDLANMLLQKNDDLYDVLKLAPDAKSSNCNGVYLCGDGNIWRQVHNGAVEELLRDRFCIVEGLTPDDRKYLGSHRGIGEVRSTVVKKLIDMGFENGLDANLDVFAVRNGVYDVSQRQFRETAPSDRVRKFADWDYSVDQAREHRAAVDRFLEQVLPIPEERQIVLRYLGSLLGGRRSIKKVLVLTDRRDGNTGKSTLVKLMLTVFGALAKCQTKFVTKGSFDRDRDSHDAGMEPFVGMRLLVAEELKKNMKLDEGLLKMLSGGSGTRVEGRKCGLSDTFAFIWQAGIILVFNEGDCPGFDVTDHAWVQRMLFVPMRSKFVADPAGTDEDYTFAIDADIVDKFPEWRSAVLDVLAENFNTGDIDPRSIPRAMLEWRADTVNASNTIAEWLDEVIQPAEGVEAVVLLSQLQKEYTNAIPGNFKALAKSWFATKGFAFVQRGTPKVDGAFKPHRNYFLGCTLVVPDRPSGQSI